MGHPWGEDFVGSVGVEVCHNDVIIESQSMGLAFELLGSQVPKEIHALQFVLLQIMFMCVHVYAFCVGIM